MLVKYLSKKTETEGVVTYSFGYDNDFGWEAGQYIRLEIKDGIEPLEHWFTILSAPYEKKIDITTRLTGSRFKIVLDTLSSGDTADVYGPDGDFTWRDDGRKKLWVAVGIGITPYISMLRQRFHLRKPLDADLLYFNRRSDIPFHKELNKAVVDHENFTLTNLTGIDISAGYINEKVPDLSDRLIYLSGPETLIAKLGAEFVENYGIEKELLLMDWFQGYSN